MTRERLYHVGVSGQVGDRLIISLSIAEVFFVIGQGVFFRRWWRCGVWVADTIQGHSDVTPDAHSRQKRAKKSLVEAVLVEAADPGPESIHNRGSMLQITLVGLLTAQLSRIAGMCGVRSF